MAQTNLESGDGRASAAAGGNDRPRSPGEYTTALVHLYRAEVGKAVAWRRRLDTTTNWAVVTTAAAISFAFGGNQAERHVVILLTSILITFFLLLESRRYRHYDIWQTRVYLLEGDFFAPILDPGGPVPDPDWGETLAADLRTPRYRISFVEALGWRLRRNYLWLYLTHLVTWLVKVSVHPFTIISVEHFYERAAVGPVSGELMVLLGMFFNGTLLALALFTSHLQSASGEIRTPRDRIKSAARQIDERRLPFGEV